MYTCKKLYKQSNWKLCIILQREILKYSNCTVLHILAVLNISFGLVSMETSKAHFLSGEKGGHCSLSMLVTVPRAQMHCP